MSGDIEIVRLLLEKKANVDLIGECLCVQISSQCANASRREVWGRVPGRVTERICKDCFPFNRQWESSE